MHYKLLRRLAASVAMALVAMVAVAQTVTVSGTVKDSNGEPVPAAAIMVVGTTNGTVSDFDGNYTIANVPSNGSLQVSFIGFQTQKLAVNGQSTINFVLQDESTELMEVVAVGYGTVTKRDLTGSVASVKAEDIASVPVSSASEALAGKMAGVNVSTTEGSPDADVKIRVRGGGSLSQDNSPLYIVDGFPVSSISDVAPSEIESIDVLKDASSTAIYGARGANGVIIVTTKSGKEGKTQVNLNASYGVKQVTKLVEVLSPYEYALYQYEIESGASSTTKSSYGDYEDLTIWKSVEGTDFQDEIFGRTGNQFQVNANVSGGTKALRYNLSYAHNDEKSIMIGSGFNKNNINLKLNSEINKWVSIDFNARLADQKITGLSGGADSNESNASNSTVAKSVTFRPITPLTQSDEDEESSSSTIYSPLDRINDTHKVQRRFRQDYNASINWKPISGLSFRTEFGFNWRKDKAEQGWGSKASQNSKFGYSGQPQIYLTDSETKTWRNANSITYDNKKLFGGRDRMNVVVGQEWSSTSKVSRESTSVAFPASLRVDECLANMGIGTALPNGSDLAAKDNLLSFFGRVNYTLMDKYLLTVTVRADGSSKFSDGNRWGIFPAAALAWRLSDEDFMAATQDWLQNLKVRLSYGTAGNNRIESGLMSTVYSLASNTSKAPFFGGDRQAMLEHGKTLYNPDLKWETTVTRNVGLDYGFLRGRISGTIDLYWNTTKDLLMKATIPSGSGYTQQYQNFGETSNKGIEFAVNYAIIDNEDMSLNFNFNIAYNTNKIEKLSSDNPYQTSNFCGSAVNYGSGDFRVAEGGQLGEVYGYKVVGIYTPVDGKGNGNITLNDKNAWELANGCKNESSTLTGGLAPGAKMFECDENGKPIFQKIGNTVAPISGGFGVDFNWKGFDFAAFFNYSLGGDVVNGTKLAASFYSDTRKGYNIVNDYNSSSRYNWIDPNNGLNLGRPSASTVELYGGAEGVMNRLNEINAGKTVANPVASTKMVMTSDFIEDGSFLRVNNVTLGYTLPKDLTQKWLMEKVRFYVTGYNLYNFTNYSGADPEVDTNKNPMCPGIDYASYPKSRSVVGGVNITF